MDYPPMNRVHQPASAPAAGVRIRALLCAVAITLATGPLSWWAIGEQSFDGAPSPDLDYAYGPYRIDPRPLYAVGGLALVLAFVSVAGLAVLTVRRRARAGWWLVAGLGAVAAFAVAGSWRVMTAGVIGANIGAGALLLLTPLFCAGVLVPAAVLTYRLLRTPA